MNVRRRATVTAIVLLVGALLAAGCGDDVPKGDDDAPQADGALTHVDGQVVVQGDRIMVLPAKGGAADEYVIGPEVTTGTLNALVSSKARARVFFRTGDTKGPAPTAVSVQPAPTAGEGAESYEGLVTKVSDSSITIDGDDGERTFDIADDDRVAFNTPHLEEHREEGEPVRIYYRGSGDDANAVAYEDA